MRSSLYKVGLVLLGLGAPLKPGRAQTRPHLRPPDRVRIAEGRQLAARVCDRVWPGWGQTEFQVLLVGDSAEFLVAPERRPPNFTPLGADAALGAEVWTRPRQFSPDLLATFPAVGGVPTVVIGSAERTGKASTVWVLTLLHEHFHQWQFSRPDYNDGVSRLGLARGDTTGQWMLDYPFPYDSAPVQRAVRSLAGSLAQALEARPDARAGALKIVRENQDSLRSLLAADDYRYLEFQLWQEGTARFIQYAVARAAADLREPSADFRRLPDYQSYGQAAELGLRDLRRELSELDLARRRRVAFYPIGAALALLLNDTRADWKQEYMRHPFRLPDLLPGGR